MRSRRRVERELHHRQQLCPFIRKAPHDVHDKHAKHLLELLVAPFDDALLHGAPSRSKGLAHPHKCHELRQQVAAELRPPIAPHDLRQSPCSEDTPCKHAPHLGVRQVGTRLEQDSVAQATHIRKHVLVARPVCRRGRPLKVNHDFLPAFHVNGPDRHRILLRGSLAEPDARRTVLDPLFDVLSVVRPPRNPMQKSHRLVRQAVTSKDPDVNL